jgi:hypothetical protein
VKIPGALIGSAVCSSNATLDAACPRRHEEIWFATGVVEPIDGSGAVKVPSAAVEPRRNALVGPSIAKDRHKAGHKLSTMRCHPAFLAAALKLTRGVTQELRKLRNPNTREPLLEQFYDAARIAKLNRRLLLKKVPEYVPQRLHLDEESVSDVQARQLVYVHREDRNEALSNLVGRDSVDLRRKALVDAGRKVHRRRAEPLEHLAIQRSGAGCIFEAALKLRESGVRFAQSLPLNLL